MALSENYRTETIGRSDCRPIVRLSADTIVRWDYRPNPSPDHIDPLLPEYVSTSQQRCAELMFCFGWDLVCFSDLVTTRTLCLVSKKSQFSSDIKVISFIIVLQVFHAIM